MAGQTIPWELQSALARDGFTDAEILSVNERKGRFCLRAKYEDADWFVKWNDPDKQEHFLAFKKEKKVYEALAGSGVVPEMMEADDELLALKFLGESRTLRSLLLAKDGEAARSAAAASGSEAVQSAAATNGNEAVRCAIDAYGVFLDTLQKNGRELKDSCKAVNGRAQFDRHLWQLFQSGPQDTKVDKLLRKVNQLPLARARRQNRIGEHLRAGGVNGAAAAKPSRALIHGDLHLNNFLLGETVTLLDFEDVMFGYVEIELAYFLAQVEALLDETESGGTGTFEVLRDAALTRLAGRVHMGLFEEAFAWYRAAIAYNPRFLRGSRPLSLTERNRRWKQAVEISERPRHL